MSKNPYKTILTALAILLLLLWLEQNSSIWVAVSVLGVFTLCALWLAGTELVKWWNVRDSGAPTRGRGLKFLASVMLLFLCTGSLLYLAAFHYMDVDLDHDFNTDRADFVNTEYILRSIFCSLDLFMLDMDSNVLDDINSHPHLKGAISVQAILSFSCTVALLIGLVYARLKAYRRLQSLAKGPRKGKDHLYIFFGITDASETLAESIRKGDPKALIVFVVKSNVDDDDKGGWDSIVSHFTHRRATFEIAEKHDAYVAITDSHLADLTDSAVLENGNILETMNLPRVQKVIRNLISVSASGDPRLNIFFLSDDEDDNLRCAWVLSHDSSVNSAVVGGQDKVRFFCHARQSGINRSLEDIALKRDIEISLVDYSQLAVNQLKMNPENHPARVVRFDTEKFPTAAVTPFEAMVIGFNACGREALGFLYEFGAFVDGPSRGRSPFHCTVVDSRMDAISGAYRALHPRVCEQKNPEAFGGGNLVDFENIDAMSYEFYSEILQKVSTRLNYVVIAIGDDDAGINLAISIFNYIRRRRDDISDLRIYVRTYNENKELFMQKVADHYNSGCGSNAKIINIFGQARAIYAYDMIVKEEYLEKGKRFFGHYSEFKGENPDWKHRRLKELGLLNKDGSYKPVAERNVTLDNLRKIRRKECQDLSNALHASTKGYLFELTVPEEDRKDFIDRYFGPDGKPECTGAKDGIRYPGLTERENEIVRNLAILEHMRWNAAHEMLGYEPPLPEDDIHSCDERHRKHNCLIHWDELDRESDLVTKREGWTCDYKLFDFGVVDTTFDLYGK